MAKPAAIMGDFASYRPVMTRKILQIVIEVPIEAQAEVFATLGFPTGGGSVPVAVARLDPEKAAPEPAVAQEKPKRKWDELTPAEQAGIRCNEPDFLGFLADRHPEEWKSANLIEGIGKDKWAAARLVRWQCGVSSRSEMTAGSEAANRWHKLDAEYDGWRRGYAA